MDYLSTAELNKIVFLIIGGYLFLVSFWVCTEALFPGFVRLAQDTYGRPWRNLLLGLLLLAVVGALVAVLQKLGGAGRLIGGALGLALLVFALAGSAGLARRIGGGLPHPVDDTQPWRRTLRGGMTMGLLLLIPIVNFVPLGWLALTGMGAFWRARAAQRKARRMPVIDGGTTDA
jgi:hypothetical protein